MSAQALYRRWRPQTFDDVFGQSHITRTLKNAVRTDRLAHAYLFTGLRGTGKTSVARILAKAVNCTEAEARGIDAPCNECSICESITTGRSLDLIEIDAASNTGVDDVRELREKIGFSPTEARYKVYIVDEVHMLSTAAFNALLKTLEEPPPHALFILATTEPHKLPDTIISRCQRHDFRRVPVAEIAEKLAQITAAEDIEAEPAALERIARAGTGSVRDAESLLDQVLALGEAITVQRVADALGTPADSAVSAIADALVARDAAAGLRGIAEAMDHGTEAHLLRRRLLEHLRALLLIQTGVSRERLDVPDEQLADLEAQAAQLPTPDLVAALRRFETAGASQDSGLPSLPLELALVEALMDMGSRSDARPEAESRSMAKSTSGSESTGGPGSPSTPEAESQPTSRPTSGSRSTSEPRSGSESTSGPSSSSPSASEPESAAGSESAAGLESAAEPEPADEPHAPASSSRSIDRLRDAWPGIVRAVAAKDRNVAALLKDCRPLSLDDNVATLGFFYEFHALRAGEAHRRAHITTAIGEALGSPHEIRITVVEASKAESASRPKSKSDKAKTDPVVKHAIEELGGRVAGVTAKDRDGEE